MARSNPYASRIEDGGKCVCGNRRAAETVEDGDKWQLYKCVCGGLFAIHDYRADYT